MHVGYPDPPLADGVVELCPWSLEDLDCIAEASTDPRIPAGTTVPSVYSADEGIAFVRRQWSRAADGQGLSLAVHSIELRRAVGLVSMMFRPQLGVIGLGYWVVPSARRKSIASAAVALAGDWAVGLGGFARIEAWVEPDNEASQRVLNAAGFECEGRLRSFLAIGDRRSDAFVYSRVRS